MLEFFLATNHVVVAVVLITYVSICCTHFGVRARLREWFRALLGNDLHRTPGGLMIAGSSGTARKGSSREYIVLNQPINKTREQRSLRSHVPYTLSLALGGLELWSDTSHDRCVASERELAQSAPNFESISRRCRTVHQQQDD